LLLLVVSILFRVSFFAQNKLTISMIQALKRVWHMIKLKLWVSGPIHLENLNDPL